MFTNKNNNSFNRLVLTLSYLLVAVNLTACGSVPVKSSTNKAANLNADLGIRYLQKGRLQLANEKLSKAIEQSPNSVLANHYYAILQQRLGNTNKAGQYFVKAVNLNPKDPEIRNNYGSFLCDNGQVKAAIQQFNSALKDPLYVTPEFAYTNAGICLRKAGKDTEGEAYFRNALKKKSAFPSALLEMASLYYDRQEYPRSHAFMSRYESVGKSTPKALELCTIINIRVQDFAKSESCKSALLRLFPDSPEAQRVN